MPTWSTIPIALEGLSRPLGWALLHSLWQGLLVAAAFAAIAQLLPARPQVRYRVAGLALLACAAWPIAGVLTTLDADRQAAPFSGAAGLVVDAPAAEIPARTASRVAPVGSSAAVASFERWLPTICLLWILGVATFSLVHLTGLWGARRLRRRGTRPAAERWQRSLEGLAHCVGVRRTIELLESSTARVPAVVGWLKPAIVVPAAAFAGLPPTQLEALLAHELAHIRRQDFLVNMVQAVIETLFFYHPAIWWLSNEMRRERELCCDDLAVTAVGDRRTYARALAGMAELQLGGTSLAMAADGHQPSSLRHRIERLWSAPRRPHRTTWVAGGLVLALTTTGLAMAMPGTALLFPAPVDGDDRDTATVPLAFNRTIVLAAANPSPAPAPAPAPASPRKSELSEAGFPTDPWRWSGLINGDQVEITLSYQRPGNRNQHFFSIPKKALSGDLSGDFRVQRDAGSLEFSGGFASGDPRSGAGLVRFVPDPQFASRIEALGWRLPADGAFTALLFDVTTPWIKDLASAGFGAKQLDWDELLGWRIHGIDSAWIKQLAQAGFPNLGADEVLAWRIHDIDFDEIRELETILGAAPDADEIVALKIHGVSPARARELIATFGRLDADDLIGLTIHGVDAKELARFKALGLGPIDADDAMALAIHDVNAADIEEMRRAGWKVQSVEDAVGFKIHGIDAGYAASFANLGIGEIDPDTLLAFKIHDVTPEWIRGMKALDLGTLDADELVGMKIHDITPQFIEGFRAEKISGLTADAVTALAIHGVDLETVKELRRRGFDTLDADDLVDYAIHGRRWERRK
jgi:beta-lactamase regulating signal transducer with metallopeptidase domain